MKLLLLKPILVCLLFIFLAPAAFSAEVFQFNELDSVINIVIFSSLDLYNSKYNKEHVQPLSVADVSSLDKNSVFFLDRWAMQPDDKLFTDWSTYLSIGTLGSAICFSTIDSPHTRQNLVVFSEVLVTQAVIAHWTKSFTLRTRPYVYDRTLSLDMKTTVDARMSFYSFHSSTAFSAAVYNHYYQHHTNSGSKAAIGIGYSLATASSVARLLSGKHHLTDIITGAISGSLISYFVCSLRSSNKPFSLRLSTDYLGVEFQY